MALELKQNLILTQQLVLTPQLQQSIKLLQLSKLELTETINKELLENPVLEDDAERGTLALSEVKSQDETISQDETADNKKNNSLDIELENYLIHYDEKVEKFYQTEHSEKTVTFEAFLTKKSSLYDHLAWQLKLSNFGELEEKIGEYIIGNLNEDGYLIEDIDNISRIFNVSKETVESIRKRIRSFDPVGVGSLTLEEALLSQVELIDGDLKVLLIEILTNHIKDIQKRDYKSLARKLKIPFDAVCEMIKIISLLDPKPGSRYSNDSIQYIVPDIYVHKIGSEYVVMLDENGIPALRISPYYKDILLSKTEQNDAGRQYIIEKIKSAAWFIKSIEQRKKTIIRVMESIIKFQRDFFDRGIEFLKPLTLKDVADDVGVHESTVSRVTTNKYVHTLRGLFELKYFFNTGIGSCAGTDILASEVVKGEIKKILLSENSKEPCSDQRIVEMLKKKNIKIARRTVTKYRKMLNISSSTYRKKIF